jgi:hypothetical protein
MQALFDAYHAHDARALGELYAPDSRLHFPGVELSGREAIRQMWAAWFRAFPDVASEVHEVLEFPGGYAVDWTERGTHSGRLRAAGFDIAATGRQLSWRGVSAYTIGTEGFDSVRYFVDRLDLALSLLSLRSLPGFARAGITLWRGSQKRST